MIQEKHRAESRGQRAAHGAPKLRLMSHQDVARLISVEFERLGISNNAARFARFTQACDERNVPQVSYTAPIDGQTQVHCGFVRKLGKVPTVVYVH